MDMAKVRTNRNATMTGIAEQCCKCNPGQGNRCQYKFQVGSCSSTGDPHPVTADGMNFNVYDAGEWLLYKHPLVKVGPFVD